MCANLKQYADDGWLTSEIRRIGHACFSQVYWPSIDNVINTYDQEHSIFAFSNTGKLQGFILIRRVDLMPTINGDSLQSCRPPDSPGCPLHIEFVGVDPANNGMGIGSLMMKAALLRCDTTQQNQNYKMQQLSHLAISEDPDKLVCILKSEQDNRPLFWLHVDIDNYAAQHIYKKNGFTVLKRVPDDFGYDGYIMIR